MTIIINILGLLFLIFLNDLLRNPKKYLRIKKKPYNTSKKISKQKEVKIEVKPNIKSYELRRFRLSRVVGRQLIKHRFLYESDLISPHVNRLFAIALGNYMLFRFATADLVEINLTLEKLMKDDEKVKEIIEYLRSRVYV